MYLVFTDWPKVPTTHFGSNLVIFFFLVSFVELITLFRFLVGVLFNFLLWV
jgi:hypothetical protein